MRLTFLSALLLSAFTVPALAQGCDYTRPITDADTVRILRDPEALKVLRASLGALGGANAWSGVRSIRITSTTAATKQNPASEFTSLEDFSRDDRPRALRTITTEKGTRKMVADEEREPTVATIKGQSLPVQPVSALELIATENPAIVLAAALKSKRISACLLQNADELARPGESLTWVRLFHASKFVSRAVVDVGIAKESNLPVRVRRMLPSYSLYAPPTWEEASFSNFKNQNGVLIPGSIFVRGVNNFIREITVQQIEVNAAVPESEFQQGGAR